jgi:hypothetical protein
MTTRTRQSSVRRQPRLTIVTVMIIGITGLGRRSLKHHRMAGTEGSPALPGDELVPDADHVASRSIDIAVPTDDVWPWIAQIGQGRGGFYSYDCLENLAGCDIHSADRINPDWQNIAVGDPVGLAPNLSLTTVLVEAGRSLVIRGDQPAGTTRMPFDFTWAFVLEPSTPMATRLIVRERYAYARWWSPLIVRPTGLISALMTRRMLRGIKRRAETSIGIDPMPASTQAA